MKLQLSLLTKKIKIKPLKYFNLKSGTKIHVWTIGALQVISKMVGGRAKNNYCTIHVRIVGELQ